MRPKYKKIVIDEFLSYSATAFRVLKTKSSIKLQFTNLSEDGKPLGTVEIKLNAFQARPLIDSILCTAIQHQKNYGVDIGFSDVIDQIEKEQNNAEENCDEAVIENA